ncbi:uncharacterized protein [Hemitrygon akajei]|uniref:uncharacterized protein n=1 Tax=Hemitrygon akajei TaxID=2704970 RepID=UPI003BF9C0DD
MDLVGLAPLRIIRPPGSPPEGGEDPLPIRIPPTIRRSRPASAKTKNHRPSREWTSGHGFCSPEPPAKRRRSADRSYYSVQASVKKGLISDRKATEMGGICTCIKTRPECLSDVEIDHATKSSDSEQSHFLGPDQFQEVPHAGITIGEEIAFDRDVLEPSGSFEHGAADKTTEMGGIHACVNTQSEDLSDAEADHATTLSVSEEKLFLDPDLFQGDPHTGASPPEEIAFDRSVSEPSGSFYHGADLNTAISAFLSNCEDHQLLRLTRFYKERLEQAIEERVEGVGFMLMGEDHFTGLEYHSVTELAEKGNRAGASKLLLDLVMEKGSGARSVMWESFAKQHHHLPKLSRILNEIQERGDGQFACMDTERGLSEVPKHLKESPISADIFFSFLLFRAVSGNCLSSCTSSSQNKRL